MRLLQALPAAYGKDSASNPPALIHELPLRLPSPPPSRLPLYFFEKMRYTIKHHLWRCSQALRRGACKPLIPVFNSGHRLQPSHSCMAGVFLMPAHKNGRILIGSEYARLSSSLLENQCCHSISVRYSFGIGPYLFFLFCPGKNASRITAAMKITAIVRVAVSCEPRYSPPS